MCQFEGARAAEARRTGLSAGKAETGPLRWVECGPWGEVGLGWRRGLGWVDSGRLGEGKEREEEGVGCRVGLLG